MTSSPPPPRVRGDEGLLYGNADRRSAGYKPTAAKSVDEYANMDAEDESLARWKASLGIAPGASTAPAAGPKVRAIITVVPSQFLTQVSYRSLC